MNQQQRRGRGSKRSRRRAIHLVGVVSLVALLGLFVVACGGGDNDTTGSGGDGASSGSGESINLLTWETYHEPEWLDEFKDETGISVEATNVGSPAEMFSKVKANPGQFDLILNTSGWFPQYVDADLLVPIDESKVPAMKSLKLGFDWEASTDVDGEPYGILYNWGTQPLAWFPDDVKGLDLSKYENDKGELSDWNVLWDPALKGKVSIFDDPTSATPMVPLALGFEDPYNLDEDEFEAFEEKLMALRPQIKRLTSGFDDQTAQLAAGEASVAMLNNIASATALGEEGKTLKTNNIIEGGMPAWSDNYAITKEGGESKEDAIYEFINKTLEPAWQARLIANSGNSGTLNYEQATTPEAEAEGLTPKKLDGTLIPETKRGDAFFSVLKFYQPVEDLNRRLEVWNEFKLGLGG